MTLFTICDVKFKGFLQYPNLVIEAGKTTFICGKSGCGKSTLLKLLNGTVSASEGQILYASRPILEYDSILLRRDVLLCAQSVYLFEGTIQENFHQFYAYRDLDTPSDAHINEYLEMCLAPFPLETPCTTMSGGERQRVYLAICLSFLPKVLLLDEPTSALDQKTANQLLENLTAFCKKKSITLISVSHSKELSMRFADIIIDLTEGQI